MFRAAATVARTHARSAHARTLCSTARVLAAAPRGPSGGTNLQGLLGDLVKGYPNQSGATAPIAEAPPTAETILPTPVQVRGGVALTDGSEIHLDDATLAPTPDGSVLDRVASYSPERIAKWTMHVNCGRNNTIITLADPTGRVPKKGWTSGGLEGFRKANRASYEAGYRCAVTVFTKLKAEIELLRQEQKEMHIELRFAGFGPGRDALYRALLTQEGAEIQNQIRQVVDCTPIKIGGTRAKKMRRL